MKLLPETRLTLDAKKSRWRHVWIVDVLIALLLFVIAQTVQSVLLTPAMLVNMLQRLDLPALADAADPTQIFSQAMAAASALPDWITLLSLFSTAAVIVICILYCVKLERRPATGLGFRGSSPALEYLAGYGIGVGLFALSWAICLLFGAARLTGVSPNLSWMILPFFFGFLIQGMSEEVLCRGFLMQTLSARYAPAAAIAINSALFMALHLMNAGLSLLALVNLFLFGVFASVYMWKRGNIWGVAAIHAAWNFTQGNLLGIRVSGSVLGPSVLQTELNPSAEWLNGGAFGLEGGLAVTIVLLAATLLMLFLPVKPEAQVPESTERATPIEPSAA